MMPSRMGQAPLFEETQPRIDQRGALIDRFVVPPFSVLDAAQGYWKRRKAEWRSLGIDSSLGRAEVAVPGGDLRKGHRSARPRSGYAWITPDYVSSASSVFDPVVAELVYRWFTPAGGRVLDPFAGGSVRGLVAAHLGLSYVGIDLSPGQVEANRVQAARLSFADEPQWVVGDSRELISELNALEPASEFDLVFSCPPYFDLERYSDDPRDLANARSYGQFVDDHRAVIRQALSRLAEDRFAVWVVGDVRDKRGMYRGLVADTIVAFREAGANLYNEAILVAAPGSLPFRVSGMFSSSRKLGRRHQAVLVFWKGQGQPTRLEVA